MEDQATDAIDYLGILRRRKGAMLVAMGILFLVGVAVAVLLPSVYRSTATILIEEQEIPSEMVRSTITSYADERIQIISQQVMTRSVLMKLVEKYDLYATKRKHETNEEILGRMRKDIKLNPVNADVTDRRSGARISSTIAFTLSYDSERPDAAQKVANELVSLYLDENLKNRKQKAAETSSFLSDEADRLNGQISAIEAKLASFKKANMGRLPELSQLNFQSRDRTESEMMETDRKIALLQERKIYTEGQVAQIKPSVISGEGSLDPDTRLKALRAKYATLSGTYSANHPDMVRMRQEIDALQKVTGEQNAAADAKESSRLSRLRADLAAAREKYSDDHPDVVKLKRTIVSLEEKQKQSTLDNPASPLFDGEPDNPLYITLRSQLESINNELKSLHKLHDDLKAKLESYEELLRQAPQVEREYLELNREYENAVTKYREIKAKLMEAEVAQELERDRKGERFSLIDPPEFPEKPHSPNRPAIILLGFILSLGGAIGYAGVLEVLDTSIKNTKMLSAVIGVPLLSTIPYFENAEEKARKLRARKIKIAGAFLSFMTAVLIVHFLVIPVDVLWYAVTRKFLWI